MALKKLITQRNGITTEYHRVQNIEVNNGEENTRLIVALQSYVDESYREQGVANIAARRTYVFDVPTDVVTSNNIFHVAYGLIKTLPDFEGAEDI